MTWWDLGKMNGWLVVQRNVLNPTHNSIKWQIYQSGSMARVQDVQEATQTKAGPRMEHEGRRAKDGGRRDCFSMNTDDVSQIGSDGNAKALILLSRL